MTGYLVAGNSTSPFRSQLTITLQGNLLSPTLVVVNRQFLGNKVMAVYGNLSLHGAPRCVRQHTPQSPPSCPATPLTAWSTRWTGLPAPTRIVVSSTEYDITQSETFNITAVTYSSSRPRGHA